MKIKVFNSLESFGEFEFKLTSLKELYSGLVINKDQSYADKVISGKFKYILLPKNEEEQPIALTPEVCTAELIGFKELLVIPDIEGEIGFETLAGLMFSAAAAKAAATGASLFTVLSTAQAAAALAVTAIVNIAISMALNMVMSLISPTKEFSSDPAQAQRNSSNLFNGAPLIREQGGSVPLAYGYGFAGGVLISSSISTTEG